MSAPTKEIAPIGSETTDHWYSSYLTIITVVFLALVTVTVVAALFVRSAAHDNSQRQLEDVVDRGDGCDSGVVRHRS